jgi:cytochrome P450 family 4 subfamily V/cytochrome P450 family 4
VKTIDLIPGVRRKFLVGNITALPKEGDGMLI